jgi:hypothetical protein
MMNLASIVQGKLQIVDGHLCNRFFAKGSDGRFYSGWLTQDDELKGGN